MTSNRIFTQILLILGTVVLLGWGLSINNYLFVGCVAITPFILLSAGHPDRLLMAIIILWPSKITPIGFPGKLEIVHVLIAFTCLVVFLSNIIKKQKLDLPRSINFVFALMGLQILITLLVNKNIGFAMLGGTHVGGMQYVKCGLALAMAYLLPSIRLSTKQLKIALFASIFTAFLPAIAESIFLLSGGKIWIQYYFFQYDNQTSIQLMSQAGGEAFRFKRFAGVGLPMVIFALIFIRAWIPRYALVFFAILLTALSGFRIHIIELIMIVFLWELYKQRKQFVIFLCKATALFAFGLLLFLVTYNYLPYSIQRSFSWLPFTPSESSAILEAQASTDWRIVMWKNAIYDIPDHLLLGRGLTYPNILQDQHMLLQRFGLQNSADLYYQMGYFHNGPLNFIINLGLPSFILICLLNFLILYKYQNPLRKPWDDSLVYRFYVVYYIIIVSGFVYMVFLNARPDVALLNLSMNLVILHTISYAHQKAEISSETFN